MVISDGGSMLKNATSRNFCTHSTKQIGQKLLKFYNSTVFIHSTSLTTSIQISEGQVKKLDFFVITQH
jgi:hypothetical protein